MGVVTVSMFVAYLPQVVKLIRTKKSEDISVASWVLFAVSSFCSLGYGVLLWRWEYILSAGLEFFLNLLIFILTVKYRERKV